MHEVEDINLFQSQILTNLLSINQCPNPKIIQMG